MDRRQALIAASAAAFLCALPRFSMAQDASAAPEIVDFALGDPNATVEMIEYASFTCPHCANFHMQVLPQLKRDYIETGKLRLVYREVYFDRPGLWAAMVARCAGEMRYFGVVDIVYRTQQEWTQGDAATIAGNLRRIGLSVGLTDAELDTCMQDAETAQAMIDNYEVNREEYPIEGTPALVIDGTLYGNMTYEDIAARIEDALARNQ
jgi:protein-disulfide isomerase